MRRAAHIGALAALLVALGMKFSDETCVRAGRSAVVHDLDSTLTRIRFDTWFRKTVGERAEISWECNDCGESGSGLDSTRIFPACAQAMALLPDLRTVYVWIDVGDEGAGIYKHPELFWAAVGDSSFYSLSKLARYLRTPNPRR